MRADVETATVVSSWIVRLDSAVAAEGRAFLAALPATRLRDLGGAVVLTTECQKDGLAGLHHTLARAPGVVSVSLVAAFNMDRPESTA
ncbi:MAG: hypothetical protein HY510_00820 [Acidobacteria bacterium]|nr:hypothetical protein [Acidobacteriota bacterium]